MSDRLILDLPTLLHLEGELMRITNAFYQAKPVRKDLSQAVGPYGGLAGKVVDFSHGWDERRHKITDAMEAIAKSIQAVHDTFSQVDSQLAAAIKG